MLMIFNPILVCKSFTQPTNGHLTVLTNGSTAVYTCDAGYTLRGATTYSCDTHIGNTSLVTAPSCSMYSIRIIYEACSVKKGFNACALSVVPDFPVQSALSALT